MSLTAHGPYPCTIVFDRYGGCYSEGRWTAWPLDAEDVPEGQGDGDPECAEFWGTYTGLVGKGATPEAAVIDLTNQVKEGQHGKN